MPSLVEIDLMVLGIEDENVKSVQIYGRTVRRTDGRRTTGDQKSSCELSVSSSIRLQFGMGGYFRTPIKLLDKGMRIIC